MLERLIGGGWGGAGGHRMERHLYEHFPLPGLSDFLHDVSITLALLLNAKIIG